MKKLAIITSHPIQYNAPLFRELAQRRNIKIKVFYTWSQAEYGFYDSDFNRAIHWDIPLLEGYEYEFINNVSKRPNSKHFLGIICPTLISKVEQWKPDLILIYGWAFWAHFRVLKAFHKKTPILFRGDSTMLDHKTGLKKFTRHLFLKYIYHFVQIALYVGSHNKKYFEQAGLTDKQLFYLPYTIDNNHFKDSETKKYEEKAQKLRLKLGIKKVDKVISFIGKFIKKKNPLFVLNCLQEYNNKHSEKVKLIFVGQGNEEAILRKKAEGDKNIFFLPFMNQKEIPVSYRLADIFVLPSKGPNETWGISVNEAIACGNLVLVSNKVGCAPDLVQNNSDIGEVFISESSLDFIEKLEKLLKKTNVFSRITNPVFSIQNAAQTIEKIVTKL